MEQQTVNQSSVKPVAERAAQDREIANDISQARLMIEETVNNPARLAKMALRAYGLPRLQEGLAIQETAQAAYTARQEAMGIQQNKMADLHKAEKEARQTFVDFRATGRAVFADAGERTRLGLTGAIPRDLQQFITWARSSYGNANAGDVGPILEQYGFDGAAMAAAMAGLATLEKAYEEMRTAVANAKAATAQRDTAVKALRAWIKKYNAVAKIALR